MTTVELHGTYIVPAGADTENNETLISEAVQMLRAGEIDVEAEVVR